MLDLLAIPIDAHPDFVDNGHQANYTLAKKLLHRQINKPVGSAALQHDAHVRDFCCVEMYKAAMKRRMAHREGYHNPSYGEL